MIYKMYKNEIMLHNRNWFDKSLLNSPLTGFLDLSYCLKGELFYMEKCFKIYEDKLIKAYDFKWQLIW